MGRKSKADARKPEILEHAYHAARKYGIAGLTLANIAAEMGVAPSLLSHYFDSKEDIILGLIDWMVSRYDESLMLDFASITTPSLRMEALLDARLWEFTRKTIDDRVWFDAFALTHRDEAVRNKFEALYLRDLESIMATMADLIRNVPERRRELMRLSGVVIAAAEGLGYYGGINHNLEAMEEIAEAMKQMILGRFNTILKNWEDDDTHPSPGYPGNRRKK